MRRNPVPKRSFVSDSLMCASSCYGVQYKTSVSKQLGKRLWNEKTVIYTTNESTNWVSQLLIKDNWLSQNKAKKEKKKEKYYITVHQKNKNTRTFSSEEMVSLSLEIKLHTCSMPRLRNSSLSTTSAKCCSVGRLQRKSILLS